MNQHDDGGPAFPVTPTDRSGQCAPTEYGMSLRDYAAIEAMKPLLAAFISEAHYPDENWRIGVAKDAYAMADAMLAAAPASAANGGGAE